MSKYEKGAVDVTALRFPDLTPSQNVPDDEMICADLAEVEMTAYTRLVMCTRRKEHGGRHAAGDGKTILATWPNTDREQVPTR